MVAKVVECTDKDQLYGILMVKNVSAKKVQNKIYEIKKKFYEEDSEDWTIEDVFAEFPNDWKWNFIKNVDMVEI